MSTEREQVDALRRGVIALVTVWNATPIEQRRELPELQVIARSRLRQLCRFWSGTGWARADSPQTPPAPLDAAFEEAEPRRSLDQTYTKADYLAERRM